MHSTAIFFQGSEATLIQRLFTPIFAGIKHIFHMLLSPIISWGFKHDHDIVNSMSRNCWIGLLCGNCDMIKHVVKTYRAVVSTI